MRPVRFEQKISVEDLMALPQAEWKRLNEIAREMMSKKQLTRTQALQKAYSSILQKNDEA
jgi:hypothetical protein